MPYHNVNAAYEGSHSNSRACEGFRPANHRREKTGALSGRAAFQADSFRD
jgi:hypothetical protein